jgi:hypothetical protein
VIACDEHGEPWWNDIDRRELLTHPPELSGNPTSSHLVAMHGELEKEFFLFCLTKYFFHVSKGYPSLLVLFEPANLGSSGKHATTRPPRATA